MADFKAAWEREPDGVGNRRRRPYISAMLWRVSDLLRVSDDG